jgi:acetylornithine deacetylase/succinyl-diaminopimelate desuccinylase-like protein
VTVLEDDAVELVSSLVRIESVSPWLVPDGSGERQITEYMGSWLDELGADVRVDEIEPGRVNLVARLRGTEGRPALCFTAHADTVGYENWLGTALSPRLEGDRLYGLGAADDKSGCAAALLALRSLATRKAKLRGDLLVAVTADEEGVSIGTQDLVRREQMDAAVVLEPIGLPQVVVEHQGFGWIDIVVKGRAAHGSAPDQGIDAIVNLAEVIVRLHELDRDSFRANPHPRNGATVFHTSTIEGGTDYATYPSRARLGIEIGTQPGERLTNRVREIERVFDEVGKRHVNLSGDVVVKLEREPFRAEGHDELWASLDEAMRAALGRPPEPIGLNAWTDAALVQAAGIPTLLLGPLGGNFHAPDEWLSVSELVGLCDVLERTAVAFLA